MNDYNGELKCSVEIRRNKNRVELNRREGESFTWTIHLLFEHETSVDIAVENYSLSVEEKSRDFLSDLDRELDAKIRGRFTGSLQFFLINESSSDVSISVKIIHLELVESGNFLRS